MSNFIYGDESFKIKGCALEVHKELGCGFLEEVYQEALEREFIQDGIPYEREKVLRIPYKGGFLKKEYRADFVCYGNIIVELKAIKELTDIERAQVINYLKATKMKLGLLMNFGERSLKTERILNYELLKSENK